MTQDLHDEYFNWLYSLVCDNHYSRLSYRNLLLCLHYIEFYPIIDLDENRLQDGIDFRYRFGYEKDYSRGDIKQYLDDRPCSVLEMMVALAFRVEEQIMDDAEYGNRTGQWFWNMIVSLGLGQMSDANFRESHVHQIISRFLERRYEPNGRGGLFTVDDCPYDLRDMQIWSQFQWYLASLEDNHN
jgi:hypothetical protein